MQGNDDGVRPFIRPKLKYAMTSTGTNVCESLGFEQATEFRAGEDAQFTQPESRPA
jgi:hypothetical protein